MEEPQNMIRAAKTLLLLLNVVGVTSFAKNYKGCASRYFLLLFAIRSAWMIFNSVVFIDLF